uniref:CSON004907 protein n=1 Tax=Culicoides sonorensis TaxID=179676 RepID=A0A336N1Y4_CULSO
MGPNDIQQCFSDPQNLLLEAVAKRNIQNLITSLLNGANPDLPDKQTGNSVFENLCLKADSRPFIEECIKNGANVTHANKNGKYAINFAAESLDIGNLEAVILAMKNQGTDLNVKYSNATVLNQVANKINEKNVGSCCDCITLLVENGANVNIPDHRDVTPVLVLLKKYSVNEKCIKNTLEYIFKHCAVDLDSFRDGEARTRLKDKCPELEDMVMGNDDITIEVVISHLKNRKEKEFLSSLRSLMTSKGLKTVDDVESINLSGSTLLEIAVEEKQPNIVKALLESGANPNKFKAGTMPPIQIAAQRNLPEILEMLLNSDKIKVSKQSADAKSEPILCTVIKQMGENTNSVDSSPYQRCFDLLLNHKDIDVNEADSATGNTALHFACRYRNRHVITKLLEKNAYIGMQNVIDSIAIDDIDPLVLENYFDSCIQSNHYRLGDDDFNIFADFKCLAPPKMKDSSGATYFHNEEMLPIVYLAKCKELRHLMTHPLITSFLFIKWHRLFSMFLLNLILYSIFCFSLIVYVVFFYGRNVEHGFLSQLFTLLIIIGIFFVAFRELAQLIINPLNYIKSFINYFELALVVMTITVLVTTPKDFHEYKNYHRVLASITILLAALELSLLISSLPNSFISMHIVMLKRVSYSFFKSLSINSIILLAFAFCFYTLFNDPSSGEQPKNTSSIDVPTNENAEDKADEFNRFISPGTAIIKTIVMLTGEFEAASIDFDVNASSYFVFLMFVFFMSIVLFNLLNGLAVSDTQIIKSEAEVTHFSEKAFTLHRFERSFMTQNFGILSTFFKTSEVTRYIRNKICVFPYFLPQNKIIVVPNQANKILIPINESSVDFNSGIDATTVLIDGGKDRKELTSNYCCLAPCSGKCCSRMDRKIVKRMMQVITQNERQKHSEIEKATIEERLTKIENMMAIMQDMLSQALNSK